MARRSPRSPRARLFSAVLALRDSCARRYRACRGDVVRFGPIATTFTDYVPSDDCRPGISATVTGTDAVVGQIVQTPPPSSGSIFRGQDTTTLTVQFSDGSYGIGAASFRFPAADGRAPRSSLHPRVKRRGSQSSPIRTWSP